MKKIILFITFLFLMQTNSHGLFEKKQNKTNLNRIDFINKMVKHINDYKEIKGHYPLASGKHELPVVIYLNSDLKKVNYHVHYDNVTALNYKILTDKLKSVLGDA